MSMLEPSLKPLRRCVHVIISRCHALFGSVCHPYRPELHYMRGPGPKWHARHQHAQLRSAD
jgi:hypothetical protein